MTQIDKIHPKWEVSVTAKTIVNPSEDPDKVINCLVNTINGGNPSILNNFAIVTSKGIHSLHHIRVGVKSRLSAGVLLRLLGNNQTGNSSWFFLNKQAAILGTIALVEIWDESTLGPITVTIESKDLDKVIDWLLPTMARTSNERIYERM